MAETRQFCSFLLGDDRFGVEVDEVREVIRHGRPTPVPLAPPGVLGLINLRGKIATVIDLKEQLGRGQTAPFSEGVGLVLRAGNISLLVDKIGDVVDVTDDLFEPPPETLKGPGRRLIRGAYKLDDGLLLVLDPTRAVPDLG